MSKRKALTRRRGRLIVVLGGAASGKSELGLCLAEKGIPRSAPRAFLATAQARDKEMVRKIALHQASRNSTWNTKEIQVDLVSWFRNEGGRYRAIVLDCLTLWLSNIIELSVKDGKILALVKELLRGVRGTSARVVFITNELGLGLVPGQRLARRFRDLAGQVNQLVAAEADEVYLSVAGLPLRLK